MPYICCAYTSAFPLSLLAQRGESWREGPSHRGDALPRKPVESLLSPALSPASVRGRGRSDAMQPAKNSVSHPFCATTITAGKGRAGSPDLSGSLPSKTDALPAKKMRMKDGAFCVCHPPSSMLHLRRAVARNMAGTATAAWRIRRRRRRRAARPPGLRPA